MTDPKKVAGAAGGAASNGNGSGSGADLAALREVLLGLASTARSSLTAAAPPTAEDVGGLGARISARRAQIVGTRGEVAPERLRAALSRRTPAVGLPAGTALLPSRQRLLAHQVARAADSASAILSALRPLPKATAVAAEVDAVVRSISGVVSALRREAVEPEPREQLVVAKVRVLFGDPGAAAAGTTPSGLLQRLERVMTAVGRYNSAELVEQRNQLRLLELDLESVVAAFRTFFATSGHGQTPAAVDRVPAVQAQLRVVADTTADLRTRLSAAGADDAELAAPDARLADIDAKLPPMTLARLLGWVDDLSSGSTSADLPVTGSIGLQAVASEAAHLSGIVADLAAVGGTRVAAGVARTAGGAVGAALEDARVRETLRVLASQLVTVAATARGQAVKKVAAAAAAAAHAAVPRPRGGRRRGGSGSRAGGPRGGGPRGGGHGAFVEGGDGGAGDGGYLVGGYLGAGHLGGGLLDGGHLGSGHLGGEDGRPLDEPLSHSRPTPGAPSEPDLFHLHETVLESIAIVVPDVVSSERLRAAGTEDTDPQADADTDAWHGTDIRHDTDADNESAAGADLDLSTVFSAVPDTDTRAGDDLPPGTGSTAETGTTAETDTTAGTADTGAGATSTAGAAPAEADAAPAQTRARRAPARRKPAKNADAQEGTS